MYKIESVVNPANPPSKVTIYPCLMQGRGVVVLFQAPNRGMVVASPNNSSVHVGFWTDAWDMNSFSPFYGSVTLTGRDSPASGGAQS